MTISRLIKWYLETQRQFLQWLKNAHQIQHQLKFQHGPHQMMLRKIKIKKIVIYYVNLEDLSNKFKAIIKYQQLVNLQHLHIILEKYLDRH